LRCGFFFVIHHQSKTHTHLYVDTDNQIKHRFTRTMNTTTLTTWRALVGGWWQQKNSMRRWKWKKTAVALFIQSTWRAERKWLLMAMEWIVVLCDYYIALWIRGHEVLLYSSPCMGMINNIPTWRRDHSIRYPCCIVEPRLRREVEWFSPFGLNAHQSLLLHLLKSGRDEALNALLCAWDHNPGRLIHVGYVEYWVRYGRVWALMMSSL
jgi:hypothetical protein